MKPSIAILGCGWLGLPLAKSLIQLGYSINGSTTSAAKLSLLQESNIVPFLIHCTEKQVEGDWETFLSGKDILIIDIPPKLRGEHRENFVAKIQTLISCIVKTTITNVIFISSTSVYPDTDSEITEETFLQPDAENGRQLLEAETLLKDNTNFKTTIIRFGGLIGKDRNPVKYLAGKENIENPDSPINFIHQDDCIGIISAVIEKEIWNETFNAVTPFHPTRENYYTQKAIEYGLPIPKFNHQNPSSQKIIRSDKLQRILEYKFQISEL
ncbi:SDR family oxidoreductase [Flavobacterium cerinum]|uniref:SDR family oxidoreductase n=1 Tax=Flavobacterium cerinum TaxID=2502784 RepID=A0ABY5IXC3_9FLAO|nr:SDR family oxidoreductase [Flavobacterium cerinum]UUC46142.1 SDR family oxidoreductase [Flavobacterium cerinum]